MMKKKTFYEQLLVTIQNEIKITPKASRFGVILKSILEIKTKLPWQPDPKMESMTKELFQSTKINFYVVSLSKF